MLQRLKQVFKSGEAQKPDFDHVQMAAAVLLVEVAMQDEGFDEDERAYIHQVLQKQFDLTPDDSAALMNMAERHASDSVELYSSTKYIRDAWDHDQRVKLIEMLWEIVYVDGVVHDFEANIMRRIAGLIYVSDQESGIARQQAMARLGMDKGE